MSIFHQISTLVKGTAHDILDRAVDMNSPTMLRQYVRDLETAIGETQSESAIADGHLRTLKREKSELEVKIANSKATIAHLQVSTDPNGPTLARSMAVVVLSDQKRVDQMAADVTSQEQALGQIKAAVANLQSKHDLMVSQVQSLEGMDRDSKAKEHAAAALQNAASLAGGPTSASIDNLQRRMAERHDVASAKFDQAMGALPPNEEADSSDVDALLASLTPIGVAK